MVSKLRKAKVIRFITRKQLNAKILARKYEKSKKKLLVQAAKLDW